jgi:pimeloyl-ACP methyl ester carboxylesterase
VRQRYIHVAGERGVLIDSGSEQGPTVVVLASMLAVARSYIPTLIELSARGYRALAAGAPGSGSGSPLPTAWKMEDYARWVEELLHVLDLRDVTLVGHSNSGAVALLAAAMGSRRIARLVLADAVGADMAFSLRRIIVARGLDALLEPELTLNGWSHVLFNAAFHLMNFINQVRLSARIDVTACARNIRIPTLLAWGGRDHTMPLRCARLFESILPNARRYVSPLGSHDWIVDRPAEFAAAVDSFAREREM